MKNKIILIQSIVIIFLLSIVIYDYYTPEKISVPKDGLLSPRVYTGILEPKSYLIFNLKPLQADLTNYIGDKNKSVGIYIANLRDGVSFGINGAKDFDPLSINKIPLAMIVLKKVEDSDLNLDTQIAIKKEFLDDRSGTLYEKNITSLSIRELIYYMLAESDNTATKALLSLIDFKDLQELSTYLNYYNPSIDSASPSPNNNLFLATPKSTYNLFMSLYLSTYLNPEDSELILKDLADSKFDIKTYAKLPPEAVVAQKYGLYYQGERKMLHSCGIIYEQETRFFYCIMTEGLEKSEALDVIGNVVNKIHTYIVTTKADLKKL